MPLIKKILFPVDFSDSCFGASRYVEAFAGHFEAEIMFLHIVGMGEHNLAEDLLPLRQRQLDAFMVEEFKHFSTHRCCVIGDDPAAEIVRAAGRWSPDLVMMPTHGLGVFRRLLLGSVTSKVLHDLDCPVWTGVHAETAPRLEAIHCRRILCALDLSARSQNVLQWASWLAGQRDADMGIAHVIPDLPPALYGEQFEAELVQSLAEHAQAQVRSLLAATGTSGDVWIEAGDPAKVVAGIARRFAADLLVMGRHSQSGMAGYLRHNAYSILCDSPCPVISI